jgi:hypothetical protein
MRIFWLGLLASGCGWAPPTTTTTTDTDTTTTTDTGPPVTSTPSCDPTGTEASTWHCLYDLCNYCEDCPDEDELLAETNLCPLDDPYTNGCCEVVSCTDPVLGTLDRVWCPASYGGESWWFDPVTRELLSYATLTDVMDGCSEGGSSQLYGLELMSCW